VALSVHVQVLQRILEGAVTVICSGKRLFSFSTSISHLHSSSSTMRFQKLSILIMNIMKHAAILIKVDMKWI